MSERLDLVLRNVCVPAVALGQPGDDEIPCDVGVRGGRIAEVGVVPSGGVEEVEGQGRRLLPGLIDNHVHYREPGATWKEGFVTGSAASARGGATTIGEIQNNEPLVETVEQWRAKVESVAARSRVRTLLYGCATKRNLAQVRALAAAAPAVKLFMSAGGDLEVNAEKDLRPIFEEVAAAQGLLILHAEDGDLIREELARYGERPADYSKARSVAAERMAVERAIGLAREFGTRLHLFHVSTADTLAAVRAARQEGFFVSAGACPHYLLFSDQDVAERGAWLKCNPSIKGPEHRTALREGFRDGTLDVWSSDHAPHPVAEKQQPFAEAPSGLPGADLLLPLLMRLVEEGCLSIRQAVTRACLGPAELFGLEDRGTLQPGALADMVLVQEQERPVEEHDLLSKGRFSPYLGQALRHWPAQVWVGGRTVYDSTVQEDLAEVERQAPPPLSGGSADSVCC